MNVQRAELVVIVLIILMLVQHTMYIILGSVQESYSKYIQLLADVNLYNFTKYNLNGITNTKIKPTVASII